MLTVIQYYIIIKIKKTKASRKDLKKEGIMRINSYNKFFAKVAEIMNTSIKDVKQLDGRYKVELANHVYLNVYRGGYTILAYNNAVAYNGDNVYSNEIGSIEYQRKNYGNANVYKVEVENIEWKNRK